MITGGGWANINILYFTSLVFILMNIRKKTSQAINALNLDFMDVIACGEAN